MSSDGATPLIFLAPPCPDCGQPCRHPLTMLVKCGTCGGSGSACEYDGDPVIKTEIRCSTCNGTGKVSPPPPTDEQIFGRECGACNGSGERSHYPDVDDSDVGPCQTCNGTGRIGAAQNRWTCFGTDPFPGGAWCKHEWHVRLALGHPQKEERCPRCTGLWTFRCVGRSDIVAPPEAWEAFVRQLRTRTKTTVLEGYRFKDDEDGGFFAGPDRTESSWARVLCDLVPDGIACRRGKITVVVTFEPEAS
jgi:hypothetical protein